MIHTFLHVDKSFVILLLRVRHRQGWKIILTETSSRLVVPDIHSSHLPMQIFCFNYHVFFETRMSYLQAAPHQGEALVYISKKKSRYSKRCSAMKLGLSAIDV